MPTSVGPLVSVIKLKTKEKFCTVAIFCSLQKINETSYIFSISISGHNLSTSSDALFSEVCMLAMLLLLIVRNQIVCSYSGMILYQIS
jgi:hypothetical protein